MFCPRHFLLTFINYHIVTNTLSVVSNAIDEVLKMMVLMKFSFEKVLIQGLVV